LLSEGVQVFDEHVLAEHEAEVERLKAYQTENKAIFALIRRREDIVDTLKSYEVGLDKCLSIRGRFVDRGTQTGPTDQQGRTLAEGAELSKGGQERPATGKHWAPFTTSMDWLMFKVARPTVDDDFGMGGSAQPILPCAW
jgi:hypothetical protein